jgi:hypothetical protein
MRVFFIHSINFKPSGTEALGFFLPWSLIQKRKMEVAQFSLQITP